MKLTIQRTRKNLSDCSLTSNSGFIIADFLFAFIIVIGVGIVIFGLTFSLATIEVAQYIVWSSARNYAAGNVTEAQAATAAELKFKNLSKQFPLLTGQGSTGSSWFKLDAFRVGNLAQIDSDLKDSFNKGSADDLLNKSGGESRQPWTGARATLTLKLFAGLKIPFLGKVADDPNKFSFPIRAFIIRSPSIAECKNFYSYGERFEKGIDRIDQFGVIQTRVEKPPQPGEVRTAYGDGQEDNGC